MHKFLREKINGRRFFRSLVNPKCIIWLNDDQLYVIPVNKMSSDIHHFYFILLFGDNDGIYFIHYILPLRNYSICCLLFITFNSRRCCGSLPCWPSINRPTLPCNTLSTLNTKWHYGLDIEAMPASIELVTYLLRPDKPITVPVQGLNLIIAINKTSKKFKKVFKKFHKIF